MYFLAASKPYGWRHAVLPWEGNPVSGTERVLVACSDVDNGGLEDCGVLRSTSQFGYSPGIKLYVLDPGCSSILSWLQLCGWRVLSFLQLQQQNQLCLGLAYPVTDFILTSADESWAKMRSCSPTAWAELRSSLGMTFSLLAGRWAAPLSSLGSAALVAVTCQAERTRALWVAACLYGH